jgi:predicted DNA-binding protein YlxM (UPF0122 family)
MPKTKKLSKKQLEAMEKMFMDYKSITSIAETFGVARNTVNYHVNSNSWGALRKMKENELLSAFTDGKKVDFVKMTGSAAQIMQRALANLATRHEPPTINEATRAADILKTLDNILRLDDGKPTDIVENAEKPMDSKELKKKLAVDPFSGITIDDEENDEKIN